MALNSWQKLTRVGSSIFGSGADGSLTVSADTTQSLTVRSCSGTSGTTSLNLGSAGFSNNDILLIHQTRGTGVGQWEINKVSSGGGTATLTLDQNLQYTYTDSGSSQAQVFKIPQYTDVTVNSARTWTAPSWDGDTNGFLIFAASGLVTITGTISSDGNNGTQGTSGYPIAGASGIGFAGGNGHVNATNQTGEGDVGAKTTGTSANGTGGGAGNGGGSGAADGGGGGHATSGSTGNTVGGGTGGAGGGISGAADLSTMTFGGGGGGADGLNSGETIASGGGGGGIVWILAKTISLTGNIYDRGGNAGTPIEGGRGGGRGAGGSVLLMCDTATLGTNLVNATNKGGDGTASGNGRVALHYGTSYTGTTNPTIGATQDSSFISGGGAFLFNLI